MEGFGDIDGTRDQQGLLSDTVYRFMRNLVVVPVSLYQKLFVICRAWTNLSLSFHPLDRHDEIPIETSELVEQITSVIQQHQ